MKNKPEKKYAPVLDNYGQSCFARSDFNKVKCVCRTQIMPPPDHQNPVDMHTSIMCIKILHNIKAVAPNLQEELAGETMFPLCSQYEKNDKVQLPVILRIFDANQIAVDIHTSIMFINIMQNIKAVALKLQEELAGQTMFPLCSQYGKND